MVMRNLRLEDELTGLVDRLEQLDLERQLVMDRIELMAHHASPQCKDRIELLVQHAPPEYKDRDGTTIRLDCFVELLTPGKDKELISGYVVKLTDARVKVMNNDGKKRKTTWRIHENVRVANNCIEIKDERM